MEGTTFDRPGPAVVLVEGLSDRLALEVLARRRGRDLAAEGVRIHVMDGVTGIGHHLLHFGPRGLGLRLVGLYDAGEEGHVRRGLQGAGYGCGLTRREMEALGFFACAADLEDELIRALGTGSVEGIIAAEGELASFRRLQHQPAQRGRPLQQQLRRFISGRSGNKYRYARLMAEAVEPPCVPRPLAAVLDRLA